MSAPSPARDYELLDLIAWLDNARTALQDILEDGRKARSHRDQLEEAINAMWWAADHLAELREDGLCRCDLCRNHPQTSGAISNER
jgi:hypothetical protein